MKYLVMETHPAYAVLLDEEGRYLKAANLRYEVGDTVRDIIPLREPAKKTVRYGRSLAGLASLAACFCLVFFGYYQPNFTAYGTLRIQINPDVELTISQTERVLELEGLNQDGMDLIEGYDYQGKSRDTATDELVERAIDMGYLSGGDTISITVRSSDAAWQAKEESQVRQSLEDRYGEQVVIRISRENDDTPDENPSQEVEVVIPMTHQTPPPAEIDRPYNDNGEDDDAEDVDDSMEDDDAGDIDDNMEDDDAGDIDDNMEDDDAGDIGGNVEDDDAGDIGGNVEDDDAGDIDGNVEDDDAGDIDDNIDDLDDDDDDNDNDN